jgi:hypothetical protein
MYSIIVENGYADLGSLVVVEVVEGGGDVDGTELVEVEEEDEEETE